MAYDPSLDIRVLSFSVMCTKGQVQAWINGKENKGKPDWQTRQKITNLMLEEKHYDFLCFQHVNVDKELKYNSQFHLLNHLPGYATIYPLASEIDDIEDFVPIYYDAKKWMLDPVDHGVVWFDQKSSLDNEHSIGGQVFAYGLFHEKKAYGNKSVYVYNTRLRNCYDQLFMLRCIAQLKNHFKNKNYPIVLAIDTQGNEKSNIVKSLLGDEVLLNEFVFSSSNRIYDALLIKYPDQKGKLRSQHNYNNPSNKLGGGMNDRILITPGFFIKEAELNYYNVQGDFPSYHYPVEVVLSFLPVLFMDLLYKVYLKRKPSWKEQKSHLESFLSLNLSLAEAIDLRVRSIKNSKEYIQKQKTNNRYQDWRIEDLNNLNIIESYLLKNNVTSEVFEKFSFDFNSFYKL